MCDYKKEELHVRLTEEDFNLLKKVSSNLGESMSRLVRGLIRKYFKERGLK